MSRTETDLWVACLQGERDAFGELFDRHRDRVFRHLLRFGDSPADAEDSTAIVFLELWRRRSAVHLVDGSVLPWLIVTATNVGRNASRSRRRYQRLLDALPPGEPMGDAEREAMVRMRVAATDARLASALAEPSPRDSHLLALTALAGYSITDAAEALGLTPGAARVRMHRLRQKLQLQVGDSEDPREKGRKE